MSSDRKVNIFIRKEDGSKQNLSKVRQKSRYPMEYEVIYAGSHMQHIGPVDSNQKYGSACACISLRSDGMAQSTPDQEQSLLSVEGCSGRQRPRTVDYFVHIRVFTKKWPEEWPINEKVTNSYYSKMQVQLRWPLVHTFPIQRQSSSAITVEDVKTRGKAHRTENGI
ncbi:hypothetical protein GCK32_008854 [Trichostrongylus colubriformis]|uniref:Uncharacterized protein n=1 Tax=Trichostrongylus colubriformis TaxID=6319 RepID=A0AAN8J226_TRICO